MPRGKERGDGLMCRLINRTALKAMVKAHQRRVSPGFMDAFEGRVVEHIEQKLERICMSVSQGARLTADNVLMQVPAESRRGG